MQCTHPVKPIIIFSVRKHIPTLSLIWSSSFQPETNGTLTVFTFNAKKNQFTAILCKCLVSVMYMISVHTCVCVYVGEAVNWAPSCIQNLSGTQRPFCPSATCGNNPSMSAATQCTHTQLRLHSHSSFREMCFGYLVLSVNVIALWLVIFVMSGSQWLYKPVTSRHLPTNQPNQNHRDLNLPTLTKRVRREKIILIKTFK